MTSCSPAATCSMSTTVGLEPATPSCSPANGTSSRTHLPARRQHTAPPPLTTPAIRPANTSSDTSPPSAPSGLIASGASSTTGSQVTLAWTASTDNVGVTGYLIERCQGSGCSNFAQIGSSATAGYTDAAVAFSTAYSYRVRASDAVGNLSA